jgi:hypothetical protein
VAKKSPKYTSIGAFEAALDLKIDPSQVEKYLKDLNRSTKGLFVNHKQIGKDLERTLKGVVDSVNKYEDMESHRFLQAEQTRLVQWNKKVLVQRAKLQKALTDKENAEVIREHKKDLGRLEQKYKAELKNQKRIHAALEDWGDDFSKQVGVSLSSELRILASKAPDIGENIAEGFASSLNSIRSGDIAGFARAVSGTLGQGLLKAGSFQQTRAAQRGTDSKFAGALTGLGKGINLLTGAVGGIMTVASAIMEIDSVGKGLNKTIVEGIGGFDLMATGVGNVRANLKALRGTITDGDFQAELGVPAAELAGLFGSLAEAGMPVSRLAGDLSAFTTEAERSNQATENLRDNLRSIVTTARLMGVQTSQMGQTMTETMNEMGTSLQTVEEHFAAIGKMAASSTFGTQRFFSMVLQATSGLTMMNVRLEDAGKLLTKMAKFMTQKKAAEFVSNMAQQPGMYGQEGIKKYILTGGKNVQRSQTYAAKLASRSFLKDFAQDQGMNLLRSRGLDTSNSDTLASQLSRYSEDQRSMLMSELRASGSEGMSQRVNSLIGLSHGMRGGMGRGMESTMYGDLGSKMALAFQQGRALTGSSSLNHLAGSPIMQAAMENMGLSGDQAQQMIEAARGFEGDYLNLRKMVDTGQTRSMSRERMLQTYGAAVDAQGNLTSASGASLGNTRQNMMDTSYIQAQTERLTKEIGEPIDANRALSEQIAANTLSFGDKLQMYVTQWLERIYASVESISGFLGISSGRMSERDVAARTRIRETLESQANTQLEGVSGLQSQLATKRTQRGTASGADARRLDAEIAALESQVSGRQEGARVFQRAARDVGNINSGSGATDWNSTIGYYGNQLMGRNPALASMLRPTEENIAARSAAITQQYGGMNLSPSVLRGNAEHEARRDMLLNMTSGVNVPLASSAGTSGGATAAATRPIAEAMAQGNVPVVETLRTQPTADQARANAGTITEATTSLNNNFMAIGKIPLKLATAIVNSDLAQDIATAVMDEYDIRQFEKLLRASGVTPQALGGDQFQKVLDDYMGRDGGGARYVLEGEGRNILATQLNRDMGSAGEGADLRNIQQGTLLRDMLVGAGLMPGSYERGQSDFNPIGVKRLQQQHDFIYRGDGYSGSITPIDANDTMVGFRPGGPVANSGGIGGNVQVNVYGGDEQRVFRVIQMALRQAGIGPSRVVSRPGA